MAAELPTTSDGQALQAASDLATEGQSAAAAPGATRRRGTVRREDFAAGLRHLASSEPWRHVEELRPQVLQAKARVELAQAALTTADAAKHALRAARPIPEVSRKNCSTRRSEGRGGKELERASAALLQADRYRAMQASDRLKALAPAIGEDAVRAAKAGFREHLDKQLAALVSGIAEQLTALCVEFQSRKADGPNVDGAKVALAAGGWRRGGAQGLVEGVAARAEARHDCRGAGTADVRGCVEGGDSARDAGGRAGGGMNSQPIHRLELMFVAWVLAGLLMFVAWHVGKHRANIADMQRMIAEQQKAIELYRRSYEYIRDRRWRNTVSKPGSGSITARCRQTSDSPS